MQNVNWIIIKNRTKLTESQNSWTGGMASIKLYLHKRHSKSEKYF